MRGLVQIFAVGGGGFTHSQEGGGRDALLVDRLLALVGPVAKLKIGYIGHANNDRADRLTTFYARFADCARTTHLPITADAATAQDFLKNLDILYIRLALRCKWYRILISCLKTYKQMYKYGPSCVSGLFP